MQFNIIYKTTNLINGKIYVGKHIQESLEFDGYLGSGTLLLKDVKEFGKENFIRETLEITESEKEAYKREFYWVNQLSACDKNVGYNQVPGGEGFTSESARESNIKFREIHRQNSLKMWQDPIFKERQSLLMKTIANKQEIKEKFSNRLKEYWSDPEYRLQKTNFSKEMWKNPEKIKEHSYFMIERMKNVEIRNEHSEKMKSLWQNDEYKERVSKILRENNSKIEVQEKISNTMKSHWQDSEYREKTIQKQKEAQNRPEVKAKRMGMFKGEKSGKCKYHYVLKDSVGIIYQTNCITEFAINFDLTPSALNQVVNGKRPIHKGFTLVSKTLRKESDQIL